MGKKTQKYKKIISSQQDIEITACKNNIKSIYEKAELKKENIIGKKRDEICIFFFLKLNYYSQSSVFLYNIKLIIHYIIQLMYFAFDVNCFKERL